MNRYEPVHVPVAPAMSRSQLARLKPERFRTLNTTAFAQVPPDHFGTLCNILPSVNVTSDRGRTILGEFCWQNWQSAIAKGGKTGQNYNCILNSRNNYMNTRQNVWYIVSIRKNICQGHKNF
jgi:hypothetical protein